MALNTTIFSTLNPIKFSEKDFENLPPYNTRYFDQWRQPDTLRSFDDPVAFFQPWEQTDIIYLQILSNYGPHQLELYACDGELIDTFVMDYVPTSIEDTGLKVYQAAVALEDYGPGNYYFELNSGSPILRRRVSEIFTLAEKHDNTTLLTYNHNENDPDLGVIFETGINFNLRVPGGLDKFSPGMDRTVFIDQDESIIQLSGRRFNTYKFVLGQAAGVADWLAAKFRDVWTCKTVLVDGRQFVAVDGSRMEETREDLYPFAGWTLDVREGEARTAPADSVEGNLDAAAAVVYNIDTRGFGGITQPAGTNVIQIEALK